MTHATLLDTVTVKDRVGRRRYIAFRVPEPYPSRRELERLVVQGSWRLTAYEQGVAVLRVGHRDAAEARVSLAKAGLTPLTTSGTIRQAKRRSGLV